MFKKIILAIVLALPMSVFAQKFGVVDVENVFKAMPEFATMQTQMDEATKKYEAVFQKLGEELDKLYAEFQTMSQDADTPDTIKQRHMQDIQEREQNINKFRSTATQDLNRQQEQLMAPIQQKITQAIQSVGAEGGYTFIFPNEQGLLLYMGADVTNVTDAVKAQLGIK